MFTHRSGDESVFQTEGKQLCRRLWDENSKRMFQDLNRPLKYVWLANNQFTDIMNLLPTAESFKVPDNNAMNRAAKRKELVAAGLKKRNSFIDVRKGIADAVYGYNPDVVNLDLCNHLDGETYDAITKVVESIKPNGRMILFASITQCSIRSKLGNRFPQYKRIAGSLEDINAILSDLFDSKGLDKEIVPGFPITYKMQSKRPTNMYSFGWELTYNRVRI